MLNLADIIDSYRVVEVDEMISRCASDIDTVADVLAIDRNYLSIQVRLHVPYYSAEAIRECTDAGIVRKVLKRLKTSLDSFGDYNREHRRLNGIDTLPDECRVQGHADLGVYHRGSVVTQLGFAEVADAVGMGIQEHLHYIHKARADTRCHTGLFLDGFDEPICYAAFSRLDRRYLGSALKAKGLLDELDVSSDEVAVMTRAFGFSPLPANAMSKLFDRSCALLKQDGFRLVVTAVNPFLSFRGSIFSGSSFVPFATSPMRYWYSDDGHYLNRRSSTKALPQRFETPPILWLVRGLGRKTHKVVENLDIPLYNVAIEEYLNG